MRDETKAIYEMSQTNILEALDQVFILRGAFIIDNLFWSTSQFASCVAFSASATDLRRSVQNIYSDASFGVSASGSAKEKLGRIYALNTRLLTSGLHQYQYTIKGTITNDFFQLATPEQQSCLWKMGVVEFDTENVDPFGLHYVKFIFFLLIGGLLAALIVLKIAEPIIHAMEKRRSQWKKVTRRRHVRSWKEFKAIQDPLKN